MPETLRKESAYETVSLFFAILAGVLIQGYLNDPILIVLLNIAGLSIILVSIVVLRLLQKKDAVYSLGSKILQGLHWYIRVLAGVMFRTGIFLVLMFSILGVTVGFALTAAYVYLVYFTILISKSVRSDWESKTGKTP